MSSRNVGQLILAAGLIGGVQFAGSWLLAAQQTVPPAAATVAVPQRR